MATDRRVARVAEMIKREVSQLLFSGIKDERVGMGMVSVTRVTVSGDLQHAKVFVSIYGEDEAKVQTMDGLKAATGYVRSTLGKHLRLRHTPLIVFVEDKGIEEGNKVLSLLQQLHQEREANGDVARADVVDHADTDRTGADRADTASTVGEER